jgi:hypothetical protein
VSLVLSVPIQSAGGFTAPDSRTSDLSVASSDTFVLIPPRSMAAVGQICIRFTYEHN